MTIRLSLVNHRGHEMISKLLHTWAHGICLKRQGVRSLLFKIINLKHALISKSEITPQNL